MPAGPSRLFSYVSSPNNKEKTQPSLTPSLLMPFINCYHCQGALIHISIGNGSDEGERSDVVLQCLDQSFSSPFML